jgi:acyl-CoA synthetase (AMP-forming)/AMP-acid ligase II
MLGVLPLFHIYGMTVTMLATLYEGGSYWPMPEWDAGETLELVESAGITILHGVPAMFNDLVNYPEADDYTLGTVRFANAGGSSLPLEVMRRFEELFEPQLLEGYGLTETAPVTHANRPDDRRPGSIGKPLPGVEAKVVDHDFREVEPVPEGPVDSEGRSGASPADDETELDEVVGEIVVHGPNVMKEYYGRPEANEEAFTYEEREAQGASDTSSSAELRSADRSSGARSERSEGLDETSGDTASGLRGGETASNGTDAAQGAASSRTGDARETTAPPSRGPREDEERSDSRDGKR